MPLPLSVCTLLCSSCWLAYALLVNDEWILIPNACGVVLGIMQLIIYTMYCGRTKVSVPDEPARNLLFTEEAQTSPNTGAGVDPCVDTNPNTVAGAGQCAA